MALCLVFPQIELPLEMFSTVEALVRELAMFGIQVLSH
jgi:hypothetical protein